MKCPHDATEMDHLSRHGVEIDHCPVCGGVWLDKGELDHLLEAVRPAVALDNPEPVPPPHPDAESHSKGTRYQPQKASRERAVRFEDRGKDKSPKPGKGARYGSKYSGKARQKNIVEEIFDFD